MQHLVTCANAGEAAFYQSLLASAEIESELRDSRSDIGTVPVAQLFVAEEQHAQAAALIAEAVTERKRVVRHPAEGFPFLGITGLIAVVVSLCYTGRELALLHAGVWQQQGTTKVLLQLLFVWASAFALGLMIGALIALVCLLAKITWQRLKA